MTPHELCYALAQSADKDIYILCRESLHMFKGESFTVLQDFINIYDSMKRFPTVGELTARSALFVLPPPSVPDRDNLVEFFRSQKITFHREKALLAADIETFLKHAEHTREAVMSLSSQGDALVDAADVRLDTPHEEVQGAVYPYSELGSKIGPAGFGTFNIVAAPTGGGKTTFIASLVDLNSNKLGRNCLYIYSESTMEKYKANLLSVASLRYKTSVVAQSLKEGLFDETQLQEIRELEDWYSTQYRSKVLYLSFWNLSPDPQTMGTQLAQYIREHNIDYFVLDTVSRAKTATPQGYTDTEYVAKIVGVLTNVALGEKYGIKPTAGFGCVQLTKEGTSRLERTSKASVTFVEGSQASQDASHILLLMSTPESRMSGYVFVHCLKNRDRAVPIEAVRTPADFQHSYIGDYNTDTVMSAEDSLDLLDTLPLDDFSFGNW